MANLRKCYFCQHYDIIKNFVKIKTPQGDSYACEKHPGIELARIHSNEPIQKKSKKQK